MEHPYARYAKALVIVENELEPNSEISGRQIAAEIERGLNCFRLAPISSFIGKENVQFTYVKEAKGDTAAGVFLSPSIVTTDKVAKNIWIEAEALKTSLQSCDLNKLDAVKMSIAPTAGEFLSFSLLNSVGRGKPKATKEEIGFNAVTTITPTKPCLQYRVDKKPRPDLFNVCLIPDLPLHDLIEFIRLFKRMLISKTASDLMTGDVRKSVDGKGRNEKTSYSPKRPLIFRGNFPNPPRSSALGSIALLGAIGEFAKESAVSTLAHKVLNSLKNATMYMVKYGGATSYTYNDHVVDLAKEGCLREIIDSVYYSELYNEGRRKSSNTEYQKFDLFASRFLQLFNKASFRDFLAFRGEYPSSLTILFVNYFKKIEMIDPNIVTSAKNLGRWLNQVAYFSAKAEIKNGTPNYWDEIRKAKAKVLVEIESSTFSAKTGDALIAQAVTRAGRLSNMDAPDSAALFMEKTASGELSLDNAKNLLIAFSRLKNKNEQKEEPQQEDYFEEESLGDGLEDLSNE